MYVETVLEMFVLSNIPAMKLTLQFEKKNDRLLRHVDALQQKSKLRSATHNALPRDVQPHPLCGAQSFFVQTNGIRSRQETQNH